MFGPAPDLARQMLQHAKIAVLERLAPDRVDDAIATSGAGLDHVRGEHAVALADASAKKKFDLFVFLTDRRFAARFDDERWQFAYADLQAVTPNPSIWKPTLKVAAGGRIHEVLIEYDFVEPIGRFLQAICAMDPRLRGPQDDPLGAPATAEDPTGALATAHGGAGQEPRANLLLRLVYEQTRKGTTSVDEGVDVVRRTDLFARTLRFGRGAKEGWWLSPLSANDLTFAFASIFGRPHAHHRAGNVATYDFHLQGTSSGVGKAVASSALGLASMAVLGVGWVSTPGNTLKQFRLVATDTPASCSFTLHGVEGSDLPLLHTTFPRFVGKVHSILRDVEADLLLRRAAFGAAPGPDELLAIPQAALDARLRGALG